MMNHRIWITLMIAVLASSSFLGIAAASARPVSACQVYINESNASSFLPGNCAGYNVSFARGVSGSRLICAGSSYIGGVEFGAGTYNNSISNCTFSNAVITSLDGARNNLIGSAGSYNLNFSGNDSNVAVGYYFTFVPRDLAGVPGYEGFASVVPYALLGLPGSPVNSQGDTLAAIEQLAARNNYALPRFGYYAPTNSTGNITFALEAEQISKDGTVNYNPYWLVVPFWGHDILTFRKFNITSNMRYTPTYIKPIGLQENIQLPDNTSVYWNFTIKEYSNASVNYLKFYDGYQVSPNTILEHIAYNITNGSISYDRGVLGLGIHEFIGVFKAPLIGEHDNSTTETYSIGISYCTYMMPSISVPGYYSFAYNSLNMLNVFWRTNETCPQGLIISDSNTVINCKGGLINTTNRSVQLINSNNVELENCDIRGNALQLNNATNIFVNNTRLIANSANDIAANLSRSTLHLNNVSIEGYATPFILKDSNITSNSITIIPSARTTTTIKPGGQLTTSVQGLPLQPGRFSYYLYPIMLLIAVFTGLMIAISLLLGEIASQKFKRHRR